MKRIWTRHVLPWRIHKSLFTFFGHMVISVGRRQTLVNPMVDTFSPMLLGQGLGFFEAHLRISKGLVLFGFSGRFFGSFAGFPARVSEGTFWLFQVFWRLFLVVLWRFVEFGEAAAVGAGGCGSGERDISTSFGAILDAKIKKSTNCLETFDNTNDTLRTKNKELTKKKPALKKHLNGIIFTPS